MAGIIAVSPTQSMTSGDTAVDKSVSGYITGEQITLTASPAGDDYEWSLSLPAGSSSGRVRFAGEDESEASFTPDISGTYTVTVDVDGTTYAIRIACVNLALTNSLEGVRLSPVADSQIPAPAVGMTVYFSSTQNALAAKNDAGTVFTVDVTEV